MARLAQPPTCLATRPNSSGMHAGRLAALAPGHGRAASSKAHRALRGDPRACQQTAADNRPPAGGRGRRDCCRGGEASEACRVSVPTLGRAPQALLCDRRPRMSTLQRTHAPRRARHRGGVGAPLPARPRRVDRRSCSGPSAGPSVLAEPCAATRRRRGVGRVAERYGARGAEGVMGDVRLGAERARQDRGWAGFGRRSSVAAGGVGRSAAPRTARDGGGDRGRGQVKRVLVSPTGPPTIETSSYP